jgi:hypothetical protein
MRWSHYVIERNADGGINIVDPDCRLIEQVSCRGLHPSVKLLDARTS